MKEDYNKISSMTNIQSVIPHSNKQESCCNGNIKTSFEPNKQNAKQVKIEIKNVSIIRECHNYALQTSSWHLEERTLNDNSHMTANTQF